MNLASITTPAPEAGVGTGVEVTGVVAVATGWLVGAVLPILLGCSLPQPESSNNSINTVSAANRFMLPMITQAQMPVYSPVPREES
jgi:hypothetical protein